MFTIKQNNLEPDLEISVSKADGSAVNFTDALGVVLRFLKPDGSIVSRNATFTAPASSGKVKASWQAGDTDQVGLYRGEFTITWPVAEPQTVPSEGYFYWEVTRPL